MSFERMALEYLEDDWTEPWILVRLFQDVGLPASAANEMALVFSVYLLACGYARFDPLDHGRFEPDSSKATTSIAALCARWESLGSPPNIGDLGVLEITRAGSERLSILKSIEPGSDVGY